MLVSPLFSCFTGQSNAFSLLRRSELCLSFNLASVFCHVLISLLQLLLLKSWEERLFHSDEGPG